MLDHVIPLHERHLLRLGNDYIRYYHQDRTHIGLDKQTPAHGSIEQRPTSLSTVVTLPRIGGLHHRYTWFLCVIVPKGRHTRELPSTKAND